MIRLTEAEIKSICETFVQFFLTGDKLWIFGSRVKAGAKGGDIDLYIETSLQDTGQVVDKKLQFLVELQNKIGEQKIDVVIKLNDNFSSPIYQIAKETGIRLV